MAELPIEEGQLIAGKYRVERILGSGAMGVVVAAWHLELAQRVAVKFVRPDALTLRDAEERFRREARAAARIRSEHVVRVVDVGTLESGAAYMVMEYLDGHDLSQELLVRGPLPAYEAVSYVQQTIEALAEAHTGGIVHRDLKPANLFLARRPDGTRVVKVLDFGVSKSERGVNDLSLTQTSAIIGSPLYMAPEQLRSARDVDHRSDIWSLGVILFELLVGRAPYLGDSIAGLVTAMMDSPPSPRSFRPELSEALERVVLRCLERDPKNRFADVGELAGALVEFAPESRLHADRARRVLGVSHPTPSVVDVAAQTMNSTDNGPAAATSREPTMAAWGEHQTSGSRRPVKRTALVALAGLLGLSAAAVVLWRSQVEVEPAQAPPAAAVQAATVAAPEPAALPPPAPPPPPASSIEVVPSASAPLVAPVPQASVVAVAPPPLAARPPLPNRPFNSAPQKPAAAPQKPSGVGTSQLPDFGGRR